MSSNKPKPLVFPSIKAEKLATRLDSEAPPQAPARQPAEPPQVSASTPPAAPQSSSPQPPSPQPSAPQPVESAAWTEPDPVAAAAAETAPKPPAATKPRAPAPPPPRPAASAPALQNQTPLNLTSPIGPQRLPPRRPEPDRTPLIVAALASLAWVGGLAAFTFGYQSRSGPLASDAFGMVVLAVLAIGPLGFVWATAIALRQARAVAAEARRAQQLTDLMIGPAAIAAAEAGTIVEHVRAQVDSASYAAAQAVERLTSLREILARETAALAEASNHAHRTAVALTDGLSKERNQMNTLAVTLDARAAAVADAMNRQGEKLQLAADLAVTLMGEAEANLTGRTADLAAAAMEAKDVSLTAADDLSRQILRLETAGHGVGDQLRALEEGLTSQRAALVTVAHALRADQEDFATLAESRAAQLSTFIANSQRDVASLTEVTSIGAQALSDLVEAAAAKFRELADHATAERDLFAETAMGSLNTLTEAGDRERRAIEEQMRQTIAALSGAASEAREAADVHAEAARARVEQLNEAAFAAGQKADAVFEARLSEARGLIEQSAKLVEEAGARTATKLEQGVNEARTALEGLHAVIDEVGARVDSLPREAEARANAVREAIGTGIDQLLDSARRAADETRAIDAAFQTSIKRNYEMLSEAVQLMGVVTQRSQRSDVLGRPATRPALRGAEPAPTPEQPQIGPPASTVPEPSAPVVEPLPPAVEALPAVAPAAEGPRLRLTPTATDQEFKAVFEAASGAPAPAADGGWTWKELLTSIDGDAAGQDAEEGRALFREIEGMGIDPVALLSRNRVDEIAAAIQTEDAAGAREVVRTLAPAAVRRLSRRLISDSDFRNQGQTFVTRYAAIVAEAMRRDRGGYQAAALLASDAGRAYLLLDAAAGDVG